MEKEIKIRAFKAKYPMIFVFGFFLASAALMGRYSPLPAALVGALSGTDCLTACIGAAIGFLARGDFIAAIPSLIALAVICTLRLIFGKIKGKTAACGSAALTGSGILLANVVAARSVNDILISAAFALISALSCYAFWKTGKQLKKGGGFFSPRNVPSLPLAVAAVFLTASLSSLSAGIFNLGIIASSALILICVYKFRFGGLGAAIVCASGLAVGLPMLSSQGSAGLEALTLAAGAMAAAAAVPKGKLLEATAFLFAAIVSGAIFGMSREMLAFGVNVLVGSAAFMALPLNLILGSAGSAAREGDVSPARVFSGRLELAGSTMGELKYALEKTAEALDGGVSKDVSDVYNSACDKICKSCRFNMKCWGDEYNDSVRTMNGLIKRLRQGERAAPENISGALSDRCQRKQQLCDSINKKYDDFVSVGQMNRRIKEMRGILTKQLDNTEKLFAAMAGEFDKEIAFDGEASVKVQRIMERCGATEPKAAVRTIDGKMTVEGYGGGRLKCTAEELGDMLIDALGREFDLPNIIEFGKKVRITAFQRADYGVRSAVCQLSRKRDSVSGDYVTGFIDGKGKYYSIMSDGMGSGTRARVDSAFACGLLTKLLESGADVETAAEMLNTSLMVKSSDESFATLDVCQVDLYTGRTVLYKAGGSDTFIRSGRTVTKIRSAGLPIGVGESLAMS
ncbi:MAG: SpoIIE family protein phosphatase, partial [[Eubacterium] siraeum]|nr:SpoIIE family protein phosphatase [[Eubacterium] siraeum]